MQPQAVDAGVAHLLEPAKIGWWLTLRLHRQARGRLDGARAVSEDLRAAVGRTRGAGGEHHVLHAVEPRRCRRHFGQLLRSLFCDGRFRGQRLTDRAELASRLAVTVARAGLKHGRGQHVSRVQRRDFPIRNTVRGRKSVEARLSREGNLGDRLASAQQRRAASAGSHVRRVRRKRRGVVQDRHHDRLVIERDRFVIRRSGPAAAAQAGTFRIDPTHTKGLQLTEELRRALEPLRLRRGGR